jgi:hypothetical protein
MALEHKLLIKKNSFPYYLLSYWNLVKKSDNFPKRGYGNVVTKTPEKHFIVTVKKKVPAMANFHLKKPLTESFVMKIGCQIP